MVRAVQFGWMTPGRSAAEVHRMPAGAGGG